jgi:predicted nuclease of predicted toxin-antitoxin system
VDIFLADESVDFRLIKALRDKGFIILTVSEVNPGITDDQVLAHCVEYDLILITEDKDFGKLMYQFNKPNRGIILFRLAGLMIDEKVNLVANAFGSSYSEFKNAYSVLSGKKLRIRKSNNPGKS